MQLSFKHLFTAILSLNFINSYSGEIYKKELSAFKVNPKYAGIFDRNVSFGVNEIQQNINNYPNIPLFQHLMVPIAFYLGDFLLPLMLNNMVVVTPETMPQLYKYVDDICKEQSISTPTLLISRQDYIPITAVSYKILLSSGAVLLEQRTITESTDAALEAIIAHELGHLKYNHTNKTIFLSIVTFYVCKYGLSMLLSRNFVAKNLSIFHLLLFRFIRNKHFEKEADKFAYETLGKGDGLIEAFKLMEKKEAIYEQGFIDTYNLLQKSRNKLGIINYLRLARSYYTERAISYLQYAYEWLSHNTFLGEHPGHEARIATIREYQKNLESTGNSIKAVARD